MKTSGKTGYRSFFLSLVLLFASSCTIEHKIAGEAGTYINRASLLLLFPDELFIQVSKEFDIPDSLNDEEKSQAAIDSCYFLKNIDFNDYKNRFIQKIIKLYGEYGFNVYLSDQLDSFLTLKTPAYVIEFTQLQLEEFWKPYYYEEEMPDGYIYSQRFVLNALGLNAWIRISKLNDTTGTNHLIYSEEVISDDIDGMFVMDNITGEVNYIYNFTPLKEKDADYLIDKASISISLDITDYLANSYIEKRMLELRGTYPERLWQYKPNSNKLSPTHNKSGYIIME